MMTMTTDETQPYASLGALQHASDELIASIPDDELSISDSEGDAISQRIALFIERATMTGTVLDAPNDRRAAQAIVDFWQAKSCTIPGGTRAKQRTSTKANNLLRSFDPATVISAIKEGEAVLTSLHEKDAKNKSLMRQILPRMAPSLGDKTTDYGNLARRMLLRKVRMSDTGRTCAAVAVERSDLLSLGDPERTNEVLDAFIAAGVLGAEAKESGDLISLRYEALTREWDALRSLIDKRVGFRDAAIFWGQRARAKGALISARLADEALADYADLNALERAFIAASSSHSRRRMIFVSVVCAVVLGVFGFVSKNLHDRWLAAKQEAEAATAVLVAISTTDARSKEESIRKLASFGKPLNLQSLNLQDLDLNGIYTGGNSPAIAVFFKSGISKVKLVGAYLPYASFSQSNIQGVDFMRAELTSARFDEAVITETTFSGATLYRAIFDRAQFKDVDFSNTDLRSTSFRNVGIKGHLVFTGTAWWLALGWTLPQIEQFVAEYKDLNIKEAKVFTEEVASGRKKIENTVAPEDRVLVLNDLAWTYATYGADLNIAKEYVQKALNENQTRQKALNENKKIKENKEKSETWIADNNANFADTMAYILLQEGQPAEAVKLLEQPGIVDANSDGDLMFRYAVALHALAQEQQGDDKESLEQKAQAYLEKSLRNRNYVPSHELYLLRRYITDKFKDKLATILSTEAN
jgi:uncharacterized protein YjbI with pentapeptide repeats